MSQPGPQLLLAHAATNWNILISAWLYSLTPFLTKGLSGPALTCSSLSLSYFHIHHGLLGASGSSQIQGKENFEVISGLSADIPQMSSYWHEGTSGTSLPGSRYGFFLFSHSQSRWQRRSADTGPYLRDTRQPRRRRRKRKRTRRGREEEESNIWVLNTCQALFWTLS